MIRVPTRIPGKGVVFEHTPLTRCQFFPSRRLLRVRPGSLYTLPCDGDPR